MIRCPYCKNQLTETSPACPSCFMDLSKLRKHLGPFPLIAGGFSDAAKALTRREGKRITLKVQDFNRRFPQSRLHVVIRIFQEEIPFSSLLFYIFNVAGLSEEVCRGSNNRDILLVIDPLRKEAGIMLGYGLEPFIPQEALDDLFSHHQTQLAEGELAEALTDIIAGLSELLATLSTEISENLGLVNPAEASTQEFDF